MSTPVSALLTGQVCLAASAARANPSASSPSTSPLTVSTIPVRRKPPALSGPSDTSAVTSSDRGAPPASATRAARLGNDTSYVPTWELLSSTWPEPSCRLPVQAVRAVRVGIGRSFCRVGGSPPSPIRTRVASATAPQWRRTGPAACRRTAAPASERQVQDRVDGDREEQQREVADREVEQAHRLQRGGRDVLGRLGPREQAVGLDHEH